MFLLKTVNELIILNFKYDLFKLVNLNNKIDKYNEISGADWITIHNSQFTIQDLRFTK